MAINRIQKGSPEAFMEAVENKITELGRDVASFTKVTASYGDGLIGEDQYTSEQLSQRNQDVYDWVADHKEALEDAENRFRCDLNDIDYIELIAWIYDHRQLWSDFTSRFTDIARWYIEDELGEEWDDYIESSTDIKAADEYDDDEYLDALKLAVEGYVEAQGYSCTADIIDNLYFEVQLFDDDEEDFETPIHVYVLDLEDIEPNMDEVDDDAKTIADDAVEDYESALDEIVDEKYTEISSKSVLDSDGFTTDYTMYRDNTTGTYFFMFGDKDIYGPDPAYADWECETKEQADEWFDSYNGFDEDEDY